MDKQIFIEGITSVSALITALRSGTARRLIKRIYFDKSRIPKEYRRYRYLKSASEELGFLFIESSPEFIEEHSTGHTHGGIIAEVSEAVFPDFSPSAVMEYGFCSLIDGAEDPYTLGNCIRTLWSFGTDMLILPRRIPEGSDAILARASAGISELMPIYLCDPSDCINIFNAKGYTTVCAGIRDSVSCADSNLKLPILLVVGGEKRGISTSVSEKCTVKVRIPYGRSFMGSLSTSSALSVIAYEIMKQNIAEKTNNYGKEKIQTI